MATVLVTGGAGYIGSHTCVDLMDAGHDVIVLDHLGNSSGIVLDRIHELTGKAPVFLRGDVRDRMLLRGALERGVDAVIHFAGWKAVGESVEQPLRYYTNNLDSTMILCEEMERVGIRRLVFSSSATVYRTPAAVPIPEDAPLWGNCPYGWTKLMNEQILRDVGQADPRWSILLLRYFNPVGAHRSGRIGEDPNGTPNNLVPYITQTAIGRREFLTVNGNDYPTPDGTCIRDYIHVQDLAHGHTLAVGRCLAERGVEALNLGTGVGTSVLQVIESFETTTGVRIPCRIGPRRPGDVAECYADPSRAAAVLGWRAEKGMIDMLRDAWNWQRMNPDGYRGPARPH
ncbi:MAG: UDP-glucose 4-epimerase GalE [Clostridia bacterium]|nr:UDP-glucose 4-epimerase GalE [Clostridia bacterium]